MEKPLAIYALARVDGNDVVTLTEQHIYGSARLGLQSRDLVLYNQPSGSGIGGGNRTGLLDSTGKKGIVITEIFAESVFGDAGNGRIIILGNVSDRRISLDGLALSSGLQSFALPSGYVLDSAERLVIAYGSDSLQDAMVGWLGWPADSTFQWVWQDAFALSASGTVELTSWDGDASTTLEVVQYDGIGVRRSFAGRDAAVASSDFASDAWSLGSVVMERRSVRNGFGEAYSWTQVRGGKSYELSDHLGNVAVVVSDRRIAVDGNADLAVDFFEAEALSARDFYPFGMVMPGRSFSAQAYRYGFNGKEFDSEWKGEGNSYDYGFRVHDPRLGRFLSVDPLAYSYPTSTPYQFAGNSAIMAIDANGLAIYVMVNGKVYNIQDPELKKISAAETFLKSYSIMRAALMQIRGEDFAGFILGLEESNKTDVYLSLDEEFGECPFPAGTVAMADRFLGIPAKLSIIDNPNWAKSGATRWKVDKDNLVFSVFHGMELKRPRSFSLISLSKNFWNVKNNSKVKEWWEESEGDPESRNIFGLSEILWDEFMHVWYTYTMGKDAPVETDQMKSEQHAFFYGFWINDFGMVMDPKPNHKQAMEDDVHKNRPYAKFLRALKKEILDLRKSKTQEDESK